MTDKPSTTRRLGWVVALTSTATAVLSAVAPQEMGKASGINYMAQRPADVPIPA